MNEYTHNCIKCTTKYTSRDEDAYYCSKCLAEKKAIAQEVDRKMANRASKREAKSELQLFNELAKTRGVRGFVNARDLGINL